MPNMPSPSMQLVETKLHPPRAARAQVRRSSLVDQIVGARAKLVLLCTPAGFGKTTALAQAHALAAEQGIECGWITLEESDNDVSRFMDCLAALALGMGGTPSTRHGPMENALIFSSVKRPFIIFLDDFEVIQDPTLLSLLRNIVDHLPERGKVVLGSRQRPPLGLGRLLARGEALEIRTDMLRFSFEETRAFFGHMGAAAPDIDLLTRLHARSEGWPAALQLAALTLERCPAGTDVSTRLFGSGEALAQFLEEDVLAHQPTHLRDFLLRTSVLRHVDLSICQALCPQLDCVLILQELERANLFLIPVADPGNPERTWRYHSLFAQFLRDTLQRELPELVPRLHLAASGWYESHDRPVPAIDHAIEGGDFPLALGLLATHAVQFLEQGRARLLSRWFGTIPANAVREHPMLQIVSAWATGFTAGASAALQALQRAGCFDSPDPAIRLEAQMLYPLLLAMQDRCDQAYEAGRQVLSQPHQTAMAFAQAALLNAMSGLLWMKGDVPQSRRMLQSARRQQGAGSAFNLMYSESLDGIHDLHEGRLRQARTRFKLSIDASSARTYHPSHGSAWPGVLYAAVLYEANEIELAEQTVNNYLPVVRDVGTADHLIISHLVRTRLLMATGQVPAAFACVEALEVLGLSRQLARVAAAARLERSRLLLLQGHAGRSRHELEAADDPAVWDRERRQRLLAHDMDYLALARIRWEIHFGQPQAALSMVESEIDAATQTSRPLRLLKLRILRALALHRARQTASALPDLTRVLHITCQEGAVRLILDEGPALRPLLEQCQQLTTKFDGAASMQDPILSDYLARLLEAIGPYTDATLAAPRAAPTEPLTPKELRVLELLADGDSNNAMSEKLCVSNSTVRTHLRNINAKMGTRSRAQALALARRMALVR